MKLKHIIMLQNKIDLVKESQAKEQQEQILKFVQGNFSFYSCYISTRVFRFEKEICCSNKFSETYLYAFRYLYEY